MALYCSREIFQALDGMRFPATKDDLLDYAELKDAREAVVVMLNTLDDNAVYHEISDVCENVNIACNLEISRFLQGVPFPVKREDLLRMAEERNATDVVRNALSALPSGFTFESMDTVCRYIL